MLVEASKIQDLWRDLPGRVTVAAAPELHPFRKDGRVLVVEPETASWAVLEARQYRLIDALMHRPRSLEECLELLDLDPWAGKELLGQLYFNQIVSLNYRFFHNPTHMWEGSPRLPHFFVIRSTTECNFNCRYCYANTGSKGHPMPVNTMKTIIERVMAELPAPLPVFEFHGGEPLLNLPSILEAMEYGYSIVDKYRKNLQFLIQTNGSLITPQILKELEVYNVGVGISLDGSEEVHNRNRVFYDGRGTWQKVMQGLTTARQGGNGTGVLCSIHRAEDYLPAFEAMIEAGYDSFALRSIFPGGKALGGLDFPEERNAVMADACIKVFDRLIKINRRSGKRVQVREINFLLYNIAHKSRSNMCMRTPCGAGTAIASFNVKGDIFPCDDFTDMMEFRMGNIFDNRPLPMIISESRPYRNLQARTLSAIPHCRGCAWRNICCSACPVSAYTLYGNINREDFLCGFYRRVIPEFIWRVADSPQIIEEFSQGGKVSLPDLNPIFYNQKRARPKR